MSAPYDPAGEAPITSQLSTVRTHGMLNNYKRIGKVGGGHHGTVYLCYQVGVEKTGLAVVSYLKLDMSLSASSNGFASRR